MFTLCKIKCVKLNDLFSKDQAVLLILPTNEPIHGTMMKRLALCCCSCQYYATLLNRIPAHVVRSLKSCL